MRKFNIVSAVDSVTFRPMKSVQLQKSAGKWEELSRTPIYTLEQQDKINTINTALSNKGLPVLTEEEIDYMFDLGKYSLINKRS